MIGEPLEVNTMESEFTHFDSAGNAIMVDVSEKTATNRIGVAEGIIQVSEQVMNAILEKAVKKGDVLSVARIAGIMGVKKTHELIPLCHAITLDSCNIDFFINKEKMEIKARCSVRTFGKTGVEMEAMTGVSIALLTIYDMCKAIDKRMTMSEIHLVKKTGGKSGDYYA